MQVELDGTHRVTPLVQTPFVERNGIISPDGRWLAYEANDSGGNLHGLNLTARHGIEIETTYATTSASSRPDTRPAGITPLPC